MKKVWPKILLFIFVLILAIAVPACNFVSGNGSGESGSNPVPSEYEESEISNYGVKVPVETKLIDSLSSTKAGKVSMKNAHETKYQNVAEVLSATKIDKASVAIYITNTNGTSAGSGTIIDVDDGIDYGDKEDNIFYIVTCHHVIGNCGNISVYVPDENGRNYLDEDYQRDANGYVYEFTGVIGGTPNREQEVSLIGGDKTSDVAVLMLYVKEDALAKNIVKAKVVDNSSLSNVVKGETAFSIGNPTGELPGTVSGEGSVSYLNRATQVDSIGNMTLMQINIDIYAGSSGGGLFNMYGELIGITNAGDTSEIGINYAVPYKISEDATVDKGFVNIAKQLIGTYTATNYGYVSGRHESFGFSISTSLNNVYVYSVVQNSYAYSAGIITNDIITSVSVNGEQSVAVSSVSEFSEKVNQLEIGKNLVLNISRITSKYGVSSTKTYTITLTAYQYYFCNTGNYTGNLSV